MKEDKVIITSALPYVNAKPHIGFAFEIILADIYARFYKLLGKKVKFISGTDENSFKIFRAAQKIGLTAHDMADTNSKFFIDLKEKLKLSTDVFIRTSSPEHKKSAHKFWNCLNKNDLYEKEWNANYCPECESFLFDKEVKVCPYHKINFENITEKNLFFKINNYTQTIKTDISSKKLIILPNSLKNNFVKEIQNYDDINISRKKETDWGITTPENENRVMYSFFDALIGYITAVKFEQDPKDFKAWWNKETKIIQFIGRDILKFHALYWPAMLYSVGINKIPNYIIVHGFITKKNEKISKSKGNIIDIDDAIITFGAITLRYYFAKKNLFEDIEYSEEKLLSTQQEIVRISSLINKIKLSLKKDISLYPLNNSDKKLFKKYSNYMNNFHSDLAMKMMMDFFIKLEKKFNKNNTKFNNSLAGRSLNLINDMLKPIITTDIWSLPK